MAISVFTGKPGNGKTLTMMHFMTEDLIRTERHIVTNIPLKLPELAEYLQEECDRRKVRLPDLNKRLTVLDTTEALYFWRYRSGRFILPPWDGKAADGKTLPEDELLEKSKSYWEQIGSNPNYAKPCSYYISEAHRYYNAKRFQRISVIAELYVTHHRHLHDEVYFDTQFPKQLAVALRELTEEWHVLRNDYNRNIGIIKMIPRIRMASYYDMPSGGSQNKPFAKRSVFIKDNGVAGCYHSTGALGAIERASDTEEKKVKKGIDLRLFIVVILFGTLGTIGVFAFGSQAVFGLMFGGPALKKLDPSDEKLTDNPTNKITPQDYQYLLNQQAAQEAAQDLEGVTLTSWQFVIIKGALRFRGTLSTGQNITEKTKGFGGANPETLTILLHGVEIAHIPQQQAYFHSETDA